ncbi:MAG: Flp family type IVb pilin [Vibrio sp.]|uniref:Flp family type IVb pilin n=1 Tax=Vibrio sp. TaxID=678 RepID=UPI003A839F85
MFNKLLCHLYILKNDFFQDKRGVTAVEYAIIAVAMSTIVLAVYNSGDLGTAMAQAMATVRENITSAATVSTGTGG